MYVHTYTPVCVCVCACTGVICPIFSTFLINWPACQDPFANRNDYLFLRHQSSVNIKKTEGLLSTKFNLFAHKHFNWLKEIVVTYSTKMSSFLNWKQSQHQLTVICAISGEWTESNSLDILCRHPSSSEQHKFGKNCIKIIDHTSLKNWKLRSYLNNIHMHIVILLVAVGNTWVTSAAFSIIC
jgi:hypothetical protein